MSGNISDYRERPHASLADWDVTPFLEKVTEVAPGIIYVFNQQTQSNEYTNKSIGRSLGYTSEEVVEMGANLMPQLLHPDDMSAVFDHFTQLQTLQDGETVSVEYRMRNKQGNWTWLLSHDTVFDRAADGSVLRHIGVASDITAQKEAEERAIEEQKKAIAVNQELRAFSYSMSHDMKSPSNTLNLLLTELLDTHRQTLDADVVQLLDMSLETVKRMGLLVDDVLNYTLVVDRDLTLEEIPLKTLVQDVLQDLQATITTAGAEITLGPLPTVKADKTQMRILFQNLIENAIKFHPPGKRANVKIHSLIEKHPQRCTVTVEDDGIGIHPSKHEKIFTIFKRLNGNMDFSGSGLGLAICRRIAANHNSAISLVSEPGQGAAFSIDLNTI